MLIENFMEIFEGLSRAHGTYAIKGSRQDNKLTGKATTVREPVTKELWQQHLEGKTGLGVIPINDDSLCKFGAIDIDTYDGSIDLPKINAAIEELKVPLFPCASKSGGIHLYLFTNEWVEAGLIQQKLKDLAAYMGYGGCEIFPKQTKILADRGDIGQWINMPYFGDTRWCQGMKPEAFIEKVMANRFTAKQLEDLVIKVKTDFEDGPPCLQHLATKGFPQGTRNNGLFNIAVYCRKKNPDNWEGDLEGFNVQLMEPPLSSSEVQGVIKSAKRKDYQYTCSKPPIAPYCNSGVCKLRKHGIGASSDMPAVHSLTKFNTNPPIWFLDIDGGGRLELETDDLHNQRRFQRKCMERLNVLPAKMNDIAWTKLINHLLENLTVIEAPPDASPVDQLFEYIERFCTGRVQAKTKEEILLGKPWSEANKHYFRMADLMAFLDRHHFRDYKVHQVTSILRENGAEHHFFNIKGKGINLWAVEAFEKHHGDFDTPDLGDNGEIF
jgi:hypothetical protein